MNDFYKANANVFIRQEVERLVKIINAEIERNFQLPISEREYKIIRFCVDRIHLLSSRVN